MEEIDRKLISDAVPFYAFPPDNYFLRATDLVPIHLVGGLDDEDLFILAAPKSREFRDFLHALGYRIDRVERHETWEGPRGMPPLTLCRKDDHVGWRAFHSTLRNLGLSETEYREAVKVLRNQRKLPEGLIERIREHSAAAPRRGRPSGQWTAGIE